MYQSDRFVNVKNTIKPTDCMYDTERLVTSHFSDNSVIADLNVCETQLNAAIQARKLAKMKSDLDKCLNSLDQSVLKQAVDNASNQNKAKANVQTCTGNVKSAQTSNKNTNAIKFGKNKLSQVDIVCQISPKFNPKMTLKTISLLAQSDKKMVVRQHIHSSIPIGDAKGCIAEFNKMASQNGIKVNREPGRSTSSLDFVFTFLITNNMNMNVCNIDASIHASQFSSIMNDSNIAKFIFDIAGGQEMSEMDHFWCDIVSEALEDNSKLNSVKSQVNKNFNSTGGFADVVRMCL